MELNDYQIKSGATSKKYTGKAFDLEDFTGVLAILGASAATTKVAGVLKKKVFHGHGVFIDTRNYKAMFDYTNAITDAAQHRPATAPFLNADDQKFVDTIIGVIDESGEVGEVLKSYLLGGITKEAFEKKLGDELGDVLWYIARASEAAGLSLADVAQGNLAKLAARYPNGFTQEQSEHRNTVSEDKALNAAIHKHNGDTLQPTDSTQKLKTCVVALREAKSTFDQLLVDAAGKVAINGSEKDVAILQNTYNHIKKALAEVSHE